MYFIHYRWYRTSLLISFLLFFGIVTSSFSAVPTIPKRTVLAEVFTATWCYYCPYAESALSQLSEKYGASKLVVLEYHSQDELSNAKGEFRGQWYAVQGFPTVTFNGIKTQVGGWDKIQQTYEDIIESQLKTNPAISISLSGNFGQQHGLINATITPSNSINKTNLKLRWVIYEDNVDMSGKSHRFVVRDVLTEDKLVLQGTQPITINKTFAINPVWKNSNLGIVGFIQDDNSKEVLQTAVFKAG